MLTWWETVVCFSSTRCTVACVLSGRCLRWVRASVCLSAVCWRVEGFSPWRRLKRLVSLRYKHQPASLCTKALHHPVSLSGAPDVFYTDWIISAWGGVFQGVIVLHSTSVQTLEDKVNSLYRITCMLRRYLLNTWENETKLNKSRNLLLFYCCNLRKAHSNSQEEASYRFHVLLSA